MGGDDVLEVPLGCVLNDLENLPNSPPKPEPLFLERDMLHRNVRKRCNSKGEVNYIPLLIKKN